MRNEPVVTYNHMSEDGALHSAPPHKPPASLYMLLIVDAIIIIGLTYAAVKLIF